MPDELLHLNGKGPQMGPRAGQRTEALATAETRPADLRLPRKGDQAELALAVATTPGNHD